MSVGIVLGAGGAFGWPFHLRVLDGVREALGHEPAGADRIVGTSAGGAIAASLLGGATTDDVLEIIATPPSAEDMAEMREAFGAIRTPWKWLRPSSLGLLPRLGLRGGLTTVVGLLPAGQLPTSSLRRFPVDRIDSCGTWPDPLWIPAVRLDDGERVVFGRDRSDVDIRDAVEATQAVPAMFRPKTIDGSRFVDGSVRSATNADLLVDGGHRVALVASPMTRPGNGPVRRLARRQLRDEVAALRAAGTGVVVVEPTAEVVAAGAGFPRQDRDAGRRLVDAARDLTIQALRAGPS